MSREYAKFKPIADVPDKPGSFIFRAERFFLNKIGDARNPDYTHSLGTAPDVFLRQYLRAVITCLLSRRACKLLRGHFSEQKLTF